jgi:outer membrane protein assembly factor BamD
MRFILVKFLFVFLLALTLPGCETLKSLTSSDSSSDKGEDEYAGWNAARFRKEADTALKNGSYDKSIKIYEALQSRYPFGSNSAQTELDIAYAYFKNGDADSAVAAADRFIKTNPRSPGVDYAYYLKGLVNYNRDIGFIDRFLPTDASQRDPGNARVAYDTFAELIRRFPDSKYVADSQQRMIALRNNLAMHDVHVARFYMKRKAYIAAVDRASYVVEKYQRTPAVPYALQILQEAYTQLDMPELAKDTARVYELNYPNGPTVSDHTSTKVSQKIWDFIGLDK